MSGGRRGFGGKLFLRLARGRPMGIGAYLFVLHRLTGVALTLYLFVHLVTLGSVLEGPEGFDRTMALMASPSVRLLELLLVGVVVFHGLNGARLLALALGPRLDARVLGYAVVALTVGVMLLSLPFFLPAR